MANTTVKGKFNVVAENGDVQTIYPKTTGDQVLVDRSSNASVIPNDVANFQHIVNKMGALALKSKVETSDFTTGTMISSLEDLKSNTDTGKIADATVVKDIESRVDTLENSNLVTVDELDAGLATKPDTEINDSVTSTSLTWSSKKLSDQLTTLNSNTSLLTSRINGLATLQEGSTTGDAELIDIRTGYDSTNYNSAGEAVRSQVSDLHVETCRLLHTINSIEHIKYNNEYALNLEYINSSMDNDGKIMYNNNPTRIVSPELIYIPYGYICKLNLNNGYKIIYCNYDPDMNVINMVYNITNEKILDSGIYRILIFKDNDANIYPEEGNTALSINIIKNEIQSLNEDYLINYSSNIVEGRYIANDGVDGSSSSFNHSLPIPLENVSHIYATGYFFCRDILSNIAFYSRPIFKSGYFISGWIASEGRDNENYVLLQEVPIPQNAKYMCISSHNDHQNFKIYAIPKHNSSFKTLKSIMNKITFHSINSNLPINIKLIGDSITHGVGGTGFTNDPQYGDLIVTSNSRSWYVNTNGVCWANMFKSYFESKFNCSVKNYGTTGRASGHLCIDIESYIETDDDIIICMIGTNDRNNEKDPVSGDYRSPYNLYNNLKFIYNYCKIHGKEIIFMSSIPASINNENQHPYHMDDVDNTVMTLCYENNIEYISLYKEFMNYCKYTDTPIDSLLSDGLHPNDNGYKIMFEIILEKLGFGLPYNI